MYSAHFLYGRKMISSTFMFFNIKLANCTIKLKRMLKVFVSSFFSNSLQTSPDMIVFLTKNFLPELGFFFKKIPAFWVLVQFCTFCRHFFFKILLFNVSSPIWKAENIPEFADRLVYLFNMFVNVWITMSNKLDVGRWIFSLYSLCFGDENKKDETRTGQDSNLVSFSFGITQLRFIISHPKSDAMNATDGTCSFVLSFLRMFPWVKFTPSIVPIQGY